MDDLAYLQQAVFDAMAPEQPAQIDAEALEIARQYQQLDDYGKRVVQAVVKTALSFKAGS